jgi:hypothetical protein
MKLFIYGYWPGFTTKDDPVDVGFFLDLFKLVFNEEIELAQSLEEGDILLESVFKGDTFLKSKDWKYTFMFSGESRLNQFHSEYDCVLCNENNHDNKINVPEYFTYVYCNNLIEKLENPTPINKVPEKDACAIIANSYGYVRNDFLEMLEKHMTVAYAGSFRNNVERIWQPYNKQDFRDQISIYKFIVSMENSIGETYITEKITHGMLSGIIPVYWGCPNISDIFNEERFVWLKTDSRDDMESTCRRMVEIKNSNDLYLDIVNKPILKHNKIQRTLDVIAEDIKKLIL